MKTDTYTPRANHYVPCGPEEGYWRRKVAEYTASLLNAERELELARGK